MKMSKALGLAARYSFFLIWLPILILTANVVVQVIILGGDDFERRTANLSAFGTFLNFGLWIGLTLLFVVVTIVGFVGSSIAGNAEAKRVLREGIDAEAELAQVRDTRTRINQNPVLEISMKVFPPGFDPFETSVTLPVSIVDIHNYHPGKRIRVKCLPHSKEVAILPQ